MRLILALLLSVLLMVILYQATPERIETNPKDDYRTRKVTIKTLLHTSPKGDKVYKVVDYTHPTTVTMFVEDKEGKVTCYQKQ